MFIVKKCSARGAFEVIHEGNRQLNLDKIKSKYKVIADLPILSIVQYKDTEITCYKNAKLIIRKSKTKEEAEEIAREIYTNLK